jgi:pilus assembly protein TadC
MMALDAYAVAAAVLSALAVILLIPPPPHPLVRAGPADRTERSQPWSLRLRRARPATIPLGRRVALGGVVGLPTGWLLLGRIGWAAWLAAALVAVGVAEFLARLESGQAERRRRELVLQAPQALDLLAATLAAGLPLRLATAAVVRACPGPVADAFGSVLKQLELGVGDVDAWRTLSAHPQLGPAAADLARSVESGTGLGSALALHAEEARAQRAAAIEIAARQVGVRSVLPLMLCFIPAFLLLGIVPTVVSAVTSALAL